MSTQGTLYRDYSGITVMGKCKTLFLVRHLKSKDNRTGVIFILENCRPFEWYKLRDLSEISKGGGGGNFKFGFGNEVTHPCNGSEIC